MKTLALLLVMVAAATTVWAEDAKPLLVQPRKIIAQPDLQQPLGAGWSIRKGTWDVKGGELVAAEVPADKHSAVLWQQVGLQSAVIECEFQFAGGKVFIIGCDSEKKHVGRLTITPKVAKLSEDASEVKGQHPGTMLGQAALDLQPGCWYAVRLEWKGNQMAARVAGKELQGEHPSLATPKARWWFAVGGAKVLVKNIKACEGKQAKNPGKAQ